jgi:mRNA interferase RelE/StbE
VKWTYEYTDAAQKDYDSLDKGIQRQVDKLIERVAENPLPKNEGGYGNPLGSKNGKNLTGLMKIKLLKAGIRVVYKLVRNDDVMKIIVIAARADSEVYNIAEKRINES